MGAYLSTPITDKESEEGGDAKYSFGVCAMQGWRTDMEDSHIINLNVDDAQKGQVALFGVFDGHGGKEVAKFCAAHIADALKATEGYKKGDYADALRQTFLDMDVIMTREEHMAELEAYRKGSDDEEGGPDGSLKKGETAMMLDSAQLPEAFLDAFGISRDSGYVFKVVKSADGQLNVQNVLDSEGNELGPGEDMEEEDADPQADPLDVVDEAVEKHTPLQLEEMNSEEEAWTGPQAGCTAVCAMVLGNQLVVANAGDSRCVLSRKGQAVALTEDHKPTNDEEFDRICKAGGFVADGRVNGSLNLSRALGDLEYKSATHVRRRFRFRPPPTRPSRPFRSSRPSRSSRSSHAVVSNLTHPCPRPAPTPRAASPRGADGHGRSRDPDHGTDARRRIPHPSLRRYLGRPDKSRSGRIRPDQAHAGHDTHPNLRGSLRLLPRRRHQRLRQGLRQHEHRRQCPQRESFRESAHQATLTCTATDAQAALNRLGRIRMERKEEEEGKEEEEEEGARVRRRAYGETDDINVLSPVHRQETIDKRRTGGSPSSRYPAE